MSEEGKKYDRKLGNRMGIGAAAGAGIALAIFSGPVGWIALAGIASGGGMVGAIGGMLTTGRHPDIKDDD